MNRYRGRNSRDFDKDKTRYARPRTAMLNLRRKNIFRYDARALLADSKVDEALASTVIANVIAKASKVSINEAKDYVRDVESRGGYGKEVSQELCQLLDKYTLYR